MHIQYLANIRMPSERANAVQTIHMCNALASLGHHVDLFVGSRPGPISVDPEEYYQTKFEFSVFKVWVPDIVALGAVFYIISTFVFSINCYRRIKKEKMNVVYCRSEWILFFLSWIMPVSKMVYESHEAKSTLPARSILKKGIKCVVISEGIRDEYLQLGFSEDQFLVAHDGIDDSFFQTVVTKQEARENLGIHTEKPIVMYIGGLDAWKGVETFFESSKLSDDFSYVVIGGREEVDRYRKEYPNIYFLGSRPYSDLKDNQQAADILVIPNTATNKLSSHYTSPLKLFAHMASGVPIVASNIPSVRNVVEKNKITFAIPDNPLSFSEKYKEVIADYGIKKEWSNFLTEYVKKYTWAARAELISRFISS